MTVIDIFSKFAWAIPIKNKTGDSITRAFEIIFKDRIPAKLHTDKGLEFINKSTQNLFKRKGIHWFATENETKAQVVERFNRTLNHQKCTSISLLKVRKLGLISSMSWFTTMIIRTIDRLK